MAIPKHLLGAISLAESGRWDPSRRASVAWPWTVTSGGQGRFFDTKAEALAEVEILMTEDVRNIEVGCMQINLYYHASAFETPAEAFDPDANTTYAATYLKIMYSATGDWTDAAGYYHSMTPERNGPYKKKVLKFWRQRGGGPANRTAVTGRTPPSSEAVRPAHRSRTNGSSTASSLESIATIAHAAAGSRRSRTHDRAASTANSVTSSDVRPLIQSSDVLMPW